VGFFMPYKLQASGSGWLVVNSDTGKPKSRRPLPRKRAEAQMRALYANVPDARTKEAGHTGVMLAFFVPPAALPAVTALQERLPNPEPSEDLHLTLAYLGDSAELSDQRAPLEELLAGIAWEDHGLPMAGTIGGIGRFHHDEGNGTNAVYASFDSPDLPGFRQFLVDALTGAGIPYAQNHGFTPHITLAYVPLDADIPTLPPAELSDVTFGVLTLAWGDERISYGPATMAAKAANYSARAGETIAGRLARGGDGKFTAAGSASATPAKSPAKQPAKGPAKPSKRHQTRAARRARKPKVDPAKREADRKQQQAARDAERHARQAKADQERHARQAARAARRRAAKQPSRRPVLPAPTVVPQQRQTFLRMLGSGDVRGALGAISRGQGASPRKALSVFKDARGRYRWLTFSSTSFQDRDREIVSTKALADDVARADSDGDYGPLRWWHVPGLDIGDCDWNAMHGRTLIESGTFRDERYGTLVAAKAADLGVSLGFRHPSSEPDHDRVFHRIRRFERSLMPAAYPSNLLTALVVKETGTVDAVKIEKLKEIGFDDEMIAAIQQQADTREKAAEAAGITFKAADAAPAADAPVETTPADAPVDDAVYVGDLDPDAFVALIGRANQPMVDALAGLAGALAGQATTKEAREQETATALKATQDALTTLQSAFKANQETIDGKLTTALKQIAELQGDVPAGVKRASQDANTIVSEKQVEALKGPAVDPMNHFFDFVTGPGAG
jgi:2'-5' RNA ligase